MSNIKIRGLGGSSQDWIVPEIDLARQAIASLRGYVYQLHQSASVWINLKEGEFLHLEVAEDYSQILRPNSDVEEVLRVTQVKDTRESGSVNLNSADVIESIESLFRLQECNPQRKVHFVFLTTSEIGAERKNPLRSGVAGITAWSMAAKGGKVEEVRAALLCRLSPGELRDFVERASDEVLRDELLSSLTFACGAHNWDVIEAENRNALMRMRADAQATADMAFRSYENVLSHIITTILASSSRRLDRKELISCLRRATTVGVPSQIVEDLFASFKLSEPAVSRKPEMSELITLAQGLIQLGSPPSINLLFPDALSAAKSALEHADDFERVLVLRSEPDNRVEATASELIHMPQRKHLIVGAGGTGKSHVLWHLATRLVSEGRLVPIFVAASQMKSCNELLSVIASLAPPGLSVESIVNDGRVCVLIDGWSEFAVGEYASEKRKAILSLQNSRVIANAKVPDVGDTKFRIWSLELLTLEQVTKTLVAARPNESLPEAAVLDLLRLPLLLSIYVLSPAQASATGELLRQFHEYLARDLPEGFSDVLAKSAAISALANDRSWGRFMSSVNLLSHDLGLKEPGRLLRQLGTIEQRGSQLLPIHDLYWSWLVGRGLVAEGLTVESVRLLHTRESYKLAIQSGARPSDDSIRAAVDDDIVLAGCLSAAQRSIVVDVKLAASIDQMFSDCRLSVRNRCALAALASEQPEYLRAALDVLTDLMTAKLYVTAWRDALEPRVLFQQRAILADWIGLPGTDVVLDAIADRGAAEWCPWLEQMAAIGKITSIDAVVTALACDTVIPTWGQQCLDDLSTSAPWKLRVVARRRANHEIAEYIATNYERLVEDNGRGYSNTWYHLNQVIVECGGEAIFEALLSRFDGMSPRSQELIGFAVVNRGNPWVGAFQKVAFAVPGTTHHHKLADVLAPEIDDSTARSWIDNGYERLGWRVLVSRHGLGIVRELIDGLPGSFANLHYIPTLAAMRFLEQGPIDLISELWSRLGDPMQPMAMQDVLNGLATVFPEGVPSIVKFIVEQPEALPHYHLAQVVKLYQTWEPRIGVALMINTPSGGGVPFPRWITQSSAIRRWEDFTPMMLAQIPDLAVDFVIENLEGQDEKAEKVLSALKEVKSFNAALFDRMVRHPKLAALIPNLFASCFDTFPTEALHRCLDSSEVDQSMLLFRMGASGNPIHRSVHARLIHQAASGLPNLHNDSCIGNLLKCHTRHDVLMLLRECSSLGSDSWIWLVREVEVARGERLINERGEPLL